MYDNVDKSHKHIKPQKVDDNENVQYDYIYTQYNNMENQVSYAFKSKDILGKCKWCEWWL